MNPYDANVVVNYAPTLMKCAHLTAKKLNAKLDDDAVVLLILVLTNQRDCGQMITAYPPNCKPETARLLWERRLRVSREVHQAWPCSKEGRSRKKTKDMSCEVVQVIVRTSYDIQRKVQGDCAPVCMIEAASISSFFNAFCPVWPFC